MRNRIATLGLVVVLFAIQPAFADTINYFTSGTYGLFNPTTPLTAPSSPFSFSFSLSTPVSLSAIGSDNFTTIAPVSYSFGASSVTVPGTAVTFFLGGSPGGGFDIQFTFNGNNYSWEFFGADQLFKGSLSNPMLITGTFPYDTSVFAFNNGDFFPLSPQEGTIVASTPVVPEPGTFMLLGTGVVLIGGSIRRKLLTGIRKVKQG